MSDYTVLGLPLNITDVDGHAVSPISAVVLLKGIDNEGYEVHTLCNTEGVTDVEALGMLNFGKMYLEHRLLTSLVKAESSQA